MAILNAPLDQELYVTMSEEFEVPGSKSHVYIVWKVLYGLRQACKLWHERFHDFFEINPILEQVCRCFIIDKGETWWFSIHLSLPE